MAVSVANYQGGQNVPKLNSLGYDDESVSLAKKCSHSPKPSRLPIFETNVSQQNGSGNSQRNPLQGNVRSSANMSSHRHSMYCGDPSSNLQQQSPSQNRNGCKQSLSQNRFEKKRASSFSSFSNFSDNSGKIKSSQSFNPSLPISTLQKVDKQSALPQQGEKSSPISKSPKSIQGSEQLQKSSQIIGQEKSSQHPDQKQSYSKLDQTQKFGESTKRVQQEQKFMEKKSSTPDPNNKISIPSPNHSLELVSPKNLDQKHSEDHSESTKKGTNDDTNSNIVVSTANVAQNPQNSIGQQSSNQQSFNYTNDLRKSMYKEQSTSFTKRLRRVFSLSNIKQDGATQVNSSSSNTSSSPSSPLSSPAITPKFSSLRSLFAKNDKKQHKELKHQHQSSQQERQRQFRTSSSDKCPSQKKRSEDKNRNSKEGTDVLNPSDDNQNKDKQQNENKPKKERNSMEIFKKKASIPPRFSSLPSRKNNRYKHPPIQPLQLQCQPQTSNQSVPVNQDSLSEDCVNKQHITQSQSDSLSEDCINKQHITQSQSDSLPTPQSSVTTSPSIETSEKLNTPTFISTIKANKPYLNMNTSASRSVPSFTTTRDTELPLTPSTPSSLKKLQFSSNILIHETWTRDDYDRRGDQTTCNKLTPLLAQKIKQELNEFKLIEMQVHEDSKKNTHFFA
ncbi:15215_t:CDS:2 [Cetraspora pellucida]|uniref:15215_t:CDS:1 n=1 Tax=Cetraspora pellucida TaxID=1433469 RepID=A0A9N9J2U0_9GLOM|nr:15215_t:CDS:2 [Cetraspora pellucida]